MFSPYRLILISLLLFLKVTTVQSQIIGLVQEKSSFEPIPNATISVQTGEREYSTITSIDGNFAIQGIKPGRYTISVEAFGFASETLHNIEVSSAKTKTLEISLEHQSEVLKEVNVYTDRRKVSNTTAVVSAKSFRVEEVSRIAGSVDDPARMIRKFPGVSQNNDPLSNQINIRGNATRTVRWRLDDIDIYNPNHFGTLSGSSGAVTIFSAQLLNNTDFYTGSFPADYGNSIGGVFDMRFRNGNTQKHEQTIGASIIGIDLAAEGPLNKSGTGSYIANYRYSTTSLLKDFLLLGTAIPTFQDLSFKLNWRIKNTGNLSLYGLMGISESEIHPIRDTSMWNERNSNYGNVSVGNTSTFGASYTESLGSNTYIKASAFVTGLNATITSYYLRENLVEADTFRLGNDIDFKATGQVFINHKFNPRHHNRTGVIYNHLYSNVSYVQSLWDEEWNIREQLKDTLRTGDGQSSLVQFFTRSQFHINEKLLLNAGLHAMYLDYTGEMVVEPRLSTKFQFKPATSFSLAYGLHSQMEPFFVYVSRNFREASQNWIRTNDDLMFNRAHHLTLGYYHNFSPQLRLGVEAYYQHQFNLVVGEENPISRVGGMDFFFESTHLTNEGTGRNMGIEIALEKSFSNNFYYMTNISIFDATYVGGDGVRRNSMFNSHVIGNLLGGKEWQIPGTSNSFGVNLSCSYAGPQYYTGIDIEASRIAGHRVNDYANPNQERQEAIALIDLGFTYKINKSNSSSQWALQVANLTNRQIRSASYFDLNTQDEAFIYTGGILPFISWKKYF